MRKKQLPVIPFTKEGYKKTRQEHDQLLEERKDAVSQLQKAREMGDLSENGFYKTAKAKLSSIDYRLNRLKYLICFAKIKEINTNGTIDIGNTIVVNDANQTRSFTIVGEHESDPSEKKISHLSPLGKALIGKRAGDEITVQTLSGITVYTIVEVT